jgi:hypothetical protein
VARLVEAISESSKNDLVHYIALRKNVLDIFGKSLEVDDTGTNQSQGLVHDIIFPRKGDTEITAFDDHNLMPDRLSWFQWIENINLYVEVLSWDKILRDARLRNTVFFHKLDIQ